MPQGKTFYRSVFISDLHMGYKGFDAPALLHFLRSIDTDTLYLVGDIIDGWKLQKRWFWPESYNLILDELIRMRRGGTQIIYVVGNHDDEMRGLTPLAISRFSKKLGIKIVNTHTHMTAQGKKYTVMHGDQFDNILIKGKVSKFSDWLYTMLIDVFGTSGPAPKVKVKGKYKPFSLAKALVKGTGKYALHLLNNFEREALAHAKRKKTDGLICGHTHIPKIRHVKDLTYINTGTWVGGLRTALVENELGILEIVDCPPSEEFIKDPKQKSLPMEELVKKLPNKIDMKSRELTLRIVYHIHRIWRNETPMAIREIKKSTQIASIKLARLSEKV